MSAATSTPIPRAFFSVAVANFLFFLNFAFFFLLPIWVLEHGGGEETAGRVVGIAGLAGLVVLPLVGYLLDRFGRRRFMIAGALTMSAVSVAFMGLETIGPMLYVLRIVQGIAFTCAFTGAQTLCVLFAPYSRRAEALGWFGISTVLTHAISPTIGEEIVLRWGFDAMFATGAVFGLAAFIMTCTLPKPPQLVAPPSAGKLDDGTARRAVLYACVAMLCYGFGFGATQTFVPVLMERFEIGRVGIFFTLWSLSAVTVRILLRKTSDRIGRRAVLVPAMATMSLAIAVLAFARSMPGICAVAITFGLAQGLLYPTMNALVADLSNPNNIGRTQSLFSGSYSLGIASCAFFFGSVAERYGYTAMFLSV
ncbi:MAG: MFS transporter, partial [Deltaproteobacteria bacterium]